jgi:hypothetical protein
MLNPNPKFRIHPHEIIQRLKDWMAKIPFKFPDFFPFNITDLINL